MEILLDQANEVYTAIKNDDKQQKEDLEELRLWESTLDDGLEDEN